MPKEVKVCKQGKRHDVLQNKNEVSNAISSQAKVGKMEKMEKSIKRRMIRRMFHYSARFVLTLLGCNF